MTMSNLERRNGVWYATLLVPSDVRDILGKTRFRKSLGTAFEREAELLAAPHIAHWKAQIRQARGSTNAVATEALRWKAALLMAPDEDTREAWEGALSTVVESKEEQVGPEHASEFLGIATGTLTPSDVQFETWKSRIKLIPKTKDQMVKDVGLLLAKFPTLEAITKANVRRWITSDLRNGPVDHL